MGRNTFIGTVSVLVSLAVSGCAQFTTSDAEKAGLERAAEEKAEAYVTCVKTKAAAVDSSTDAAFIRDAVSSRCSAERQAFIDAKNKSLEVQYIMTDKPLQKSLDQLDERVRVELAEIMLARPASSPAARAPGSMPAPAVAAVPPAAASAGAGAPASWDAQQRIYLDCMDDQAEKYASLDESAQTIADVAASRCSMYLGSESVVALEREGRAQVMGKVMDLRLQRAPARR